MDLDKDNSMANTHEASLSTKDGGGKGIADDVVEPKRRRMSKKERKALKQSKKRNDPKQKGGESVGLKNFEDSGQINEDVDAEEERIRLECMKSYQPIDIPINPSAELISQRNKDTRNTKAETENAEGGCRTLGKWFPNAIVVKTVSYTNTGQLILDKSSHSSQELEQMKQDLVVKSPRSSLVLFYQYTTSESDDNDQKNSKTGKKWDRQQLQLLITYLSAIARKRNIGGRIRVASEGVNATLSAVDTKQCTAKAALRHLAEDLLRFDQRVFSGTDFKFLDELPADRHFKEMKILPVQELVFYDIGEDDAPLVSSNKRDSTNLESTFDCRGGGVHLDAKEYHEMLKKDNTVVIDVRNNYETILGRFDGQQTQQQGGDGKTVSKKMEGNSSSVNGGGAEYIDPKMRKSTDFKSWLATPETQKKLSNKTVLMYCTGGIRCERASAYLKSQMGDQVEGVYQLKGGIERYLKTFKDGGFWRGKNFVFDKREAVSVDNPCGDGGVLRTQDRKKLKRKRQQNQKENDLGLLAKCCVCGDPWDRYVGKKKCLTCGVPVLMCEKCMSQKPDKTPGMELKVRCPLCVDENITVLADELEFTANGIKNKVVSSASDHGKSHHGDIDSNKSKKRGKEGKANNDICQNAKAANSVLKWGGGHAAQKKKQKKNSRRLCQFGENCFRKDCFFYHPERKVN